jgi:hypothetical protein
MRITSNRSVEKWGAVFGDAIVATAILDRRRHHSRGITIRGDSSRLREKRRSGLLQKPAPAPNHPTADDNPMERGVNSSCRQGVNSGCRLTVAMKAKGWSGSQ